jgi:hypothetical protein
MDFLHATGKVIRSLLSAMGVFSEFERALIRKRQREGLALAKKTIRKVKEVRSNIKAWNTSRLEVDKKLTWRLGNVGLPSISSRTSLNLITASASASIAPQPITTPRSTISPSSCPYYIAPL